MPQDIVLTRSDYLGYAERRAALAGIVQAMLITRHVLFIGFSVANDNFNRIAEAVRPAVRMPWQEADAASPLDTVLTLRRTPLVEELWQEDLHWAGMGATSGPAGSPADLEAARRLEILLDYLLSRTRDAAHLLNNRDKTALSEEERLLRDGLSDFLARLPAAARKAPARVQVDKLLKTIGHKDEVAERRVADSR